jgi:DNA-binding transcriptional regulator YiaG
MSPVTGNDIRKARKTRDWTVQMVADLLNVHRNTVIRWEAGGAIPGPAQLSLRWILNESEPQPQPRPRLRRPKSQRETVA